MTAISRKKIDTTFGQARIFRHGLAAGKHVFQGDALFLNENGFAQPFDSMSVAFIRGISTEEADNTLGGDGDKTVEMEAGTFVFNNSQGHPLGFGDIGKLAYFEDSNTVKPNTGALQARLAHPIGMAPLPAPPLVPAGIVHGFDDPDHVHVTLGAASSISRPQGGIAPANPPTTVQNIFGNFLVAPVTTAGDGPSVLAQTNSTLTGSLLMLMSCSCQSDTDEDWLASFTVRLGSPANITGQLFYIRGKGANIPFSGSGYQQFSIGDGSGGLFDMFLQFERITGTGTLTVTTSDYLSLSLVDTNV